MRQASIPAHPPGRPAASGRPVHDHGNKRVLEPAKVSAIMGALLVGALLVGALLVDALLMGTGRLVRAWSR